MLRKLNAKWSVMVPLIAVLAGGCSFGPRWNQGDVPEMHRNLSRTTDIQTAVVQGDLEKARAAASWIVAQEGRMSFPEGGRPYEAEVVRYAAQIQNAAALPEVAYQTGRLGASCGSCHQATGKGPRFVLGSGAPAGTTQEAQMIRHLWAADRMWEGLVGPSEAAWAAGARALAETTPSMGGLFRASTSGDRPERMLENVHTLASEALEARDLAARADVYGRIIETCNHCHSQNGIKVGR